MDLKQTLNFEILLRLTMAIIVAWTNAFGNDFYGVTKL